MAAPLERTWQAFNNPDDILQWDASDQWHATSASNNMTVGGQLRLHIESNDATSSFDFAATYTRIEPLQLIEFQEDDTGRMVEIIFTPTPDGCTLRQTFDADPAIPQDEQRAEWLSVLQRFARHVQQQRNGQKVTTSVDVHLANGVRNLCLEWDGRLARRFAAPGKGE